MFKELTGSNGIKVSVNPLHVMRIVSEAPPKFTKLEFTNGSSHLVIEDYNYVVNLLVM